MSVWLVKIDTFKTVAVTTSINLLIKQVKLTFQM